MRKSVSFSIERPVLSYIEKTTRNRSKSERVNELLRRAIQLERYERLEEEAAEFFAGCSKAERAEARAFQKASVETLARE